PLHIILRKLAAADIDVDVRHRAVLGLVDVAGGEADAAEGCDRGDDFLHGPSCRRAPDDKTPRGEPEASVAEGSACRSPLREAAGGLTWINRGSSARVMKFSGRRPGALFARLAGRVAGVAGGLEIPGEIRRVGLSLCGRALGLRPFGLPRLALGLLRRPPPGRGRLARGGLGGALLGPRPVDRRLGAELGE